MLQNDNSPYTLLEVGRPGVSGRIEDCDVNKVSSKYFTPFNHRMMQSSFDLCQVIIVSVCKCKRTCLPWGFHTNLQLLLNLWSQNPTLERRKSSTPSSTAWFAGGSDCWSGEGWGGVARTSFHAKHQPLPSSACQVFFLTFYLFSPLPPARFSF